MYVRKSLTIKFGQHMPRRNFGAVFAGADGRFFGHELNLMSVVIMQ